MSNLPQDLQVLINRYLDGELAADEIDTLEQWLDTSSDYLNEFVKLTCMHRQIRDGLLGSELSTATVLEREELSQIDNVSTGRAQHLWRTAYDIASNYITLSLLISAIVMTIIVLSMGLIVPDWNPARSVGPDTTIVATVTNTHETIWAPASDANLKNTSLFAGDKLVLNSGLAEITYKTGVRVVLQGPAEFAIGDRPMSGTAEVNSGFLKSGKLTAKVTAQGIGFAIATPSASIVDLGTEFGVAVDEQRRTEVLVLEGKVNVLLAGDTGESSKGVKLVTGQSARTSPDGSTISRAPIKTTFSRLLRSGPATAPVAAENSETGATGLVGYWTFDDTLEDASGHGNHGTAEQTSFGQDVPPAIGNGMSYDFDSGDTIEVPHSSSLFLDQAFTVSFWLKGTATEFSSGRLIIKPHHYGDGTVPPGYSGWDVRPADDRNGGSGGLYLFSGTHGGDESEFNTFGDKWNVSSAEDDVWNHVAIVVQIVGRPGGRVRHQVYINGELHSEQTSTAKANSLTEANVQPLSIGFGGWSGSLDDVALFGQALTIAQIAALADGSANPRDVLPRE